MDGGSEREIARVWPEERGVYSSILAPVEPKWWPLFTKTKLVRLLGPD